MRLGLIVGVVLLTAPAGAEELCRAHPDWTPGYWNREANTILACKAPQLPDMVRGTIKRNMLQNMLPPPPAPEPKPVERGA